MTRTIAVDSPIASLNAPLAVGDSLLVTRTGRITDTRTDEFYKPIIGLGQNTIRINGVVEAATVGVVSAGDGSTVSIGSTGIVRGDRDGTGIDRFAGAAVGFSDSFFNAGLVQGMVGVNVGFEDSARNDGTIAGFATAGQDDVIEVGVRMFAGELVNNGTIRGRDIGVEAYLIMVDGFAVVTNRGTISGEIAVDADQTPIRLQHLDGTIATTESGGLAFRGSNLTDVLHLFGTVRGQVFTDLGNDRVTARDRAVGAIDMGGGNDTFVVAAATGGAVPGFVVDGFWGADTLTGGNGSDRLFGGVGADALAGSRGNDTLAGGTGADTLRGDAGDDLLRGEMGDDRMTGGAGADTFFFSAANFGADIIWDFTQGDRIDLQAFDFALFSDLAPSVSSGPGGTVIDLTPLGGGTIRLAGFTGPLDAGDVIL